MARKNADTVSERGVDPSDPLRNHVYRDVLLSAILSLFVGAVAFLGLSAYAPGLSLPLQVGITLGVAIVGFCTVSTVFVILTDGGPGR